MAFHFVGIKGTGMAALAQILHDQGKKVQGSDIEKYIFTQEGLQQRNIPILSFDENNINEGDTVIVGLSFGKDHPEVAKAFDTKDVKVYWYNEYLGKLLEEYRSICVAGCHGKSTTTGLLASVFNQNAEAGFLIGDGHGHMSAQATEFILESCEFQRHFLAYHPDYAIITNIELDHVDYYKDLDDYIHAFQSFIENVKECCVIFGDDPYLPSLKYPGKKVTYGLQEGNDYQGINIHQGPSGIEYDVLYQGQIIGHVVMEENGMPILWDSLGAFALAHTMGKDPQDIVQGLKEYKGIHRRFVIEEIEDYVLVDDYAHHPTAIEDLIDSISVRYPSKKIVALFKPDRYTRLQFFLDRFAQSLSKADQVYLLDFDTTATRENDSITVTIDDLKNKIPGAQIVSIDEVSAQKLKEEGPAAFIFMSSKNIYLLKDLLAQELKK